MPITNQRMSAEDLPTQFRINEDIAGRARDGLWGHLFCLALVFGTTTDFRDHPWLMTALVMVFAAQTGFRYRLLRQSCHAPHWRQGMLFSVLLCGALWGLFLAWSCLTYGFHHPNTVMLAIFHAAVGVIGTPTLVHDVRMTRLYLVLMFVAPSLAHGFRPDFDRWSPLFAFAAYIGYLSVSAQKACADYQGRLAEHIGLSAIASTDALTGLPNRLAMRKRLDLAIERARRSGVRVAFLFIDLDGFKAINDGYSHRVGDLFLCEVANRLRRCGSDSGSPTSDGVARLGGDEFTMMPEDAAEAAGIAQQILDSIREPVVIEGHECRATASIGISFFPDDAPDADELIRAADHAMYEAKRTGANQICFAGTRRAASLVALHSAVAAASDTGSQERSRGVNSPSPLTSVSRMSRP